MVSSVSSFLIFIIVILLFVGVKSKCNNCGNAKGLTNSKSDSLMLFLMGDTQYHYPCTTKNKWCKRVSVNYKKFYGLSDMCEPNKKKYTPQQVRDIRNNCSKLESDFANRIQRQAVLGMYNLMTNKPSGMVLDGDLVHGGRQFQLDQFKKEWMSMPFKIYAGLGNHDYENHVRNGCNKNKCLDNILLWFINEYAQTRHLDLDLTVTNNNGKKMYDGSLAYTKDLCNGARNSCAHSIQLNNRPDFKLQAQSAHSWNIKSSWDFLRRSLRKYQNEHWPVIINIHNYEHKDTKSRLEKELKEWFSLNENKNKIRRPLVLMAHVHGKHHRFTKCIGGIKVPFMYVGSVPNNRYTVFKYKNDIAEFYLLEAQPDGSNTLIKKEKFEWKRC